MTVFSITAEEPTEIDFLIFIYYQEEQVVVDEIIESAESLGLVVNPIYISDWNYFQYLIMMTNDWDIYYGGSMNTYTGSADNIFNCAYGNMGYNYYYLRHNDVKYNKFSLKLWGMLQAYVADPSIADASFIDDMYDKFHDCEERLWEKQLIMPLAKFVNLEGNLMLKHLTPNCLPGYAFSDEDLRLAFSRAIDRTVVVDYLLGFGFTFVDIFYHAFGYSTCHDTTLPNCLPA
ncbi:MAG TPA: hypothetical protein VMX55_03635 [candidate division Zixibacteria bacterium]|nr:hypothetical protein [candidate division Zixibacteria bacterium]